MRDILKTNKSVLLLGPRQIGKTTLLKSIKSDLYINLADSRQRRRYERDVEVIYNEISELASTKDKKIVIVDEIQKVPSLLDDIQTIIDEKKCTFILTGSSARKLKSGGTNVNLLPGRLVSLRMDALSLSEVKKIKLDDVLAYGLLPEIYLIHDVNHRRRLLKSYVEIYLEEEVRQEALVKNLGPFGRFLELAAIESGQVANFSKIAKDVGVSPITIHNYYDILEQCLIVERVEPIFTSTTRKRLTKSCRYLFFDLGVRCFAARESEHYIPQRKGQLFEQLVGIEMIKLIHQKNMSAKLRFWRDPDGPEVDWVFDHQQSFLPIEVKFTESPDVGDAKHLRVFNKEYENSHPGIIICTSPRKLRLPDGTVCWPWQDLHEAVSGPI